MFAKEKGLPWEKAKAWDNSAAVGKWTPLQNIKNKKDLNFSLYKNKELVQQGNSGLMINSFDKVVAYISNYFSVNIGDLVFTGTPAGVGNARTPKRFIRPGETLVSTIEGIGTLETRFAS